MEYPVAGLPPNINDDDSSDMFFADEASPDMSSSDQSLWSLAPIDDISMTASPGGGEPPMSSYGDGTLSLASFDDTSGGMNDGPNMFLSG